MDKIITEKRQFPRISTTLPIRFNSNFLGETMDLSETGLRFVLERPFLLSKAQARIELSPEEFIDAEFKVIWNKHLVKENKFTYGARFIRLQEKDLEILRIILSKSKNLDEGFVNLTKNFRDYLKSVKTKFDEYDAKNFDEKDRIHFIETEKEEIFKNFDIYFKETWELVKDFTKEEYRLHQEYSLKALRPLLRVAETNRLIDDKPLGYAGDYIIMNYFYNFHNKYLGTSSYEKVINFYTCNIPIAYSVVSRKDFFKQKILETLRSKKSTRVLNVGSGPACELIELIREGKITAPLYFDCLDFDKKALDYVQNEIKKIDRGKILYLHLGLINKDIIELIRDRDNETTFKKYDLIYSSGIFDYLSARTSKKVVENLYNLLEKKGVLILTNLKRETITHRVYYEMLGKWYLCHRSREEVLDWAKDIQNTDIKFENLNEGNSFWFLRLQRR